MNLFIAGSIEENIDEKYLEEAKKYSNCLATCGNDLIFGAKNTGILKVVYESFKKEDRYIKAITIERFKEDLKKISADEEIVSANIHKQYKRFFEADAMIFFPGGVGTLSELSYMINAKRNNVINCPIYIINMFGFYDGIINEINHMYEEKYIQKKDLIKVISNVKQLVKVIYKC